MPNRLYHQLTEETITQISRRAVWFNILVPLVTLMLLSSIPYPASLRYEAFDGDAAKMTWVHHRIVADPRPIDIALIGTSRTMVAISDSLLQLQCSSHAASLGSVVNLGVSWQGRDLHAVFADDLFKTKGCGTVILEIQENLARKGHPLFTDVADNTDILSAFFLLNTGWSREVFMLPRRNLHHLWTQLLRTTGHDEESGHPEKQWGEHYHFTEKAVKSREEMEQEKNDFESNKRWRILPASLDQLEFQMPRHYLRRIIKHAEQAGTKMIFLYLPYYGCARPAQDIVLFEKHGTVLTPPPSILDNPGLWFDKSHLNDRGNELLTRWLADELLELEQRDGGD